MAARSIILPSAEMRVIQSKHKLKALVEAYNDMCDLSMVELAKRTSMDRNTLTRRLKNGTINISDLTKILREFRMFIPELTFDEDWIRGVNTRLNDRTLFAKSDSFVFDGGRTRVASILPTVECYMRLGLDDLAKGLCDQFKVPWYIFRFQAQEVSVNFHVAFINKIISLLEKGLPERGIGPCMKKGELPSSCEKLNSTLENIFRTQLAFHTFDRDIANIDELSNFFRSNAEKIDPSCKFNIFRNLEGHTEVEITPAGIRPEGMTYIDMQVSDYIVNHYKILAQIITDREPAVFQAYKNGNFTISLVIPEY